MRWIGRFIVEYDEVDIEQFSIEAKAQHRTMRSVLETDAIKHAAKAFRGLKKKTVNINGDKNARVIFATSVAGSRSQEVDDE